MAASLRAKDQLLDAFPTVEDSPFARPQDLQGFNQPSELIENWASRFLLRNWLHGTPNGQEEIDLHQLHHALLNAVFDRLTQHHDARLGNCSLLTATGAGLPRRDDVLEAFGAHHDLNLLRDVELERASPEELATRIVDDAGECLDLASTAKLVGLMVPHLRAGPMRLLQVAARKASPMVHEILTVEAADAWAAYLAERCHALNTTQVLEVGAGSGRLAHELRLRGVDVLATDSAMHPDSIQVLTADHAAAIAEHKPKIVLCGWMTPADNWTPAWRRAPEVEEIVLIGQPERCGDVTDSRTFSEKPAGWTRTDVDSVADLQLCRYDHALPGLALGSVSTTVSFRREIKEVKYFPGHEKKAQAADKGKGEGRARARSRSASSSKKPKFG